MVWDRIVDEGKGDGDHPLLLQRVLDPLRVESYPLSTLRQLQMYPFATEQPGDSLWELGLDFTVSPGKTGLAERRNTLA